MNQSADKVVEVFVVPSGSQFTAIGRFIDHISSGANESQCMKLFIDDMINTIKINIEKLGNAEDFLDPEKSRGPNLVRIRFMNTIPENQNDVDLGHLRRHVVDISDNEFYEPIVAEVLGTTICHFFLSKEVKAA